MDSFGDKGADTVTKLGTDAGMKGVEVAERALEATIKQIIHLNSVSHKLAVEQLKEARERNAAQSKAMPEIEQLKELRERYAAQSKAMNVPMRDRPKLIEGERPVRATGENSRAKAMQSVDNRAAMRNLVKIKNITQSNEMPWSGWRKAIAPLAEARAALKKSLENLGPAKGAFTKNAKTKNVITR